MPKVKVNPLILVALTISLITMVLYAYRSYSNQEIGNSVTFTILSFFILGLVIWGIFRNKKIEYANR